MIISLIVMGILCLLGPICYFYGFGPFQVKPPQEKPPQEKPPQDILKDPATCAQILACKGYNNSGANNKYTPVETRAIPNERLVRAFDIDNSFTTMENDRNREFKSEARNAIKMTDPKWQEVADVAKNLVQEAVSHSNLANDGQTTSITLDSLVRSVCLKVILHVLFDKSALSLDDKSILIITESINSLWIQSKDTKTPKASDKHALREALAQVIPEMMGSDPRKNPLNLIMPAYETLWRVVLSGFLHVTFVRGAPPTWRSILAQFLANPTTAARKELSREPEILAVSVDQIVKETLRLYPSEKRVYRQFHMDNEPGPKNVAADIEACQRSETLWGGDAQRFVPSRWTNASKEAQESYMAFGVAPFLCPAKGEFGPMMIGILVAAFADGISSENWHLRLGESSSDVAQCNLEKALGGEEPLVSDRKTYDGLRIIRV